MRLTGRIIPTINPISFFTLADLALAAGAFLLLGVVLLAALWGWAFLAFVRTYEDRRGLAWR